MKKITVQMTAVICALSLTGLQFSVWDGHTAAAVSR